MRLGLRFPWHLVHLVQDLHYLIALWAPVELVHPSEATHHESKALRQAGKTEQNESRAHLPSRTNGAKMRLKSLPTVMHKQQKSCKLATICHVRTCIRPSMPSERHSDPKIAGLTSQQKHRKGAHLLR